MTTWGPIELLAGRAVWAVVDDVHVLVVPSAAMTEVDFERLMQEAVATRARHKVTATASLSFYGFSTTPKMRRTATEFMTEEMKHSRHVVLTNSALMRGALTALTWLVPSLNVRAFAPAEWSDASSWLQPAAPHDHEQLGGILHTIFAQFGIPLRESNRP